MAASDNDILVRSTYLGKPLGVQKNPLITVTEFKLKSCPSPSLQGQWGVYPENSLHILHFFLTRKPARMCCGCDVTTVLVGHGILKVYYPERVNKINNVY